MEFLLENEQLQVGVKARGAELCSVVNKTNGREMMWQGNPEVWGSHAPLLFPYCGRMIGNILHAGGRDYEAKPHGFARDSIFTCVSHDEEKLVLRLTDNDATREVYPYAFVLDVTFTLSGSNLCQTVSVLNPLEKGENAGQPGDGVLPFSVGFHPAFALPLRHGLPTEEHELVFTLPEKPTEVLTPGGFVSGETRPRFTGQQAITLDDTLFAQDSVCLKGLRSDSITLREKNGPAGVQVDITGYPNTLLWSKPTAPLVFICIEPWHGLPDPLEEYGDFANKPGIIRLAQGEMFTTKLNMLFGQG